MPNKTLFDGLFGDNYKDFGTIGDGLQVVYALASQRFPIGYIGDRNTPARLAREQIDRSLAGNFGLIYHVELAHPNDNVVKIQSESDFVESFTTHTSMTFSCDGLIVDKNNKSFMIETLLGDCACIVVWSDDWVGYMHVGRPEIMEKPSLIHHFFSKWPGNPESTHAWMGPCITGDHYELPQIPKEFQDFATETEWGTQGLDLNRIILAQLKMEGLSDQVITNVNIDPFSVLEFDDHTWAASDQWAKRKSRELGFPVCNLRNSAMLIVTG